MENSACAIDLEDGDAKLLDFRFADDLLLFARTKFETIFMLETLMEELAYVGLCLNAGKTVVLTNEAQPPQCLILTNQDAIVVKGNDVGHKWLGCILSAGAYGRSTLDTTFHLQAASRAFFANKQILCDLKVRLAVRLRFFGSLHRLPFLLLAIKQTGWVIDANWTLFIGKCYAWSSGRQISWNGRLLGMTFCIIGMEGRWHSHSNMDWTLGLSNASNITGDLRCMLRICPRTGGSSEYYFGIRLVHELRGTHAMIGLASLWHPRDFNSGASGITLPRIRRCGCSWVMIL